MERIEKTFEVTAPVRAAYNQWTQFEYFPHFMHGVEEVVQLDDTHLHWRVSVAGKHKEWDAEIIDQIPDRMIAWRSIAGVPNAGQVSFEPLPRERTRIMLAMEYEPQSAVEKAGSAIGVLARKIERTVQEFKQFLEARGRETGGWRGEVRNGRLAGATSPGTDVVDASALARYCPGGTGTASIPERLGKSALD
ncbi:MAG: SRPBCC family protein [Betaproteobacteria bacterium]